MAQLAGPFTMPGIHGTTPWTTGPGVYMGQSTTVHQPTGIPDPFTITKGGTNAGDSANTQGNQQIPYKVPIITDPFSASQSFINGEPMFFVKQTGVNPLKKALSQKQLNRELLMQHKELLAWLSTPRHKRKSHHESGAQDRRISTYITEENFTQKIGFGGFVAPAGQAGATESSPSNPGKQSRVLAMLGRGTSEVGNLWGGGQSHVYVRCGSSVAFCVKRMNNFETLDHLEEYSMHQLLKAVGPLVVCPIGANQKYAYSIGTYRSGNTPNTFARRLRSTGRLDRSGDNYMTTYDKQFVRYYQDSWGIDGFSRGLLYKTIPGLLNIIKKNPPDDDLDFALAETCGVVLESGIVSEATTPCAPQDMVVNASTDLTQEHCGYRKGSPIETGARNKTLGDLQKEFFIKLHIYLDNGMWHLDTESKSEIAAMKDSTIEKKGRR